MLAAVVFTACSGEPLAPGSVISTDLSNSQRRVFRVTLRQGDAVRVLVEQYQADLVLTVTPPSSGSASAIDMRERGRESATLIAEVSGTFRVTVHAKSAAQPRTRFEVRLEDSPHSASERDRQWQSAERLESDGKRFATEPVPAPGTALEALRQALELWRGLSDTTGTATTLARIGDVLRAMNRFKEAEAAYADALTLFRSLGMTYQAAVTENNLGATLYALGSLNEARTHFGLALDLWASQPGADVDRAATWSNEAGMMVEYGDYQAALERLLMALPVLGSHPRLGPPVLNLLGVAYRAVGDLDAAEQYFTRTRVALPAADPRVPRLGLRLAQIALGRGETEVAGAGVRDALALIRTATNRQAEADALDLLGEVEAAAGRPDSALISHEKALALYQGAEARRGVATALHHIGMANRQLGRTDAARTALAQALAIRHAVGLRDVEAETHYEAGLLEAEAGALPLAQSHLNDAIDLIEDVRGRVSGEYSRAVYFASRQKYFASLIDVLMQLHAERPAGGFATAAFEVSERERARSLIDRLRESGTDVRRGVSASLIEQQREEQRQLDFWASRLAGWTNQQGPKAAAAAADASGRMQQHLTAYRALDGRIRSAAVRELSDPGPAFTLRHVQRQLLDPQTLLLRFALGDRRSYGWLVSPDSITVVTLPSKAEIERLARRVVDLMRTKRTPGTASGLRQQMDREAGGLSRVLLDPFAGQLGDRRLLIVCEGLLQLVPFAALPEPGSETPLVVRHEIAMLPSASAMVVVQQRKAHRAPPSKTVAVLADAVYEEDDPRLTRVKPLPARSPDRELAAEEGLNVGRLMLARSEGDWVLQYAEAGQRFEAFDFAASREAMGRLADYRIVHLAVHAIADAVRPELSALILSKYDADGRRRPGVLRLHTVTTEIDLRADVVVLSACSSVEGRDLPGEGLMGLARGFFQVGASSVIGALTTVQEEPTLELMKVLYEEMLGPHQQRPAEALRAAQLKMITSRRFGDPFYWSPFVFIGDPR